MYERILLASDGTHEGLTALREGALLARDVRARVFLLVVTPDTPGGRLADSIHPLPRGEAEQDLLQRGLKRLAEMGVPAEGELVSGEPAQAIGAQAGRFNADLVVVGHRRQGLMERWWSGASGAYLVDHVACSVLIARRIVSDEEFERRLKRPAGA